jgi:hypothetical protein
MFCDINQMCNRRRRNRIRSQTNQQFELRIIRCVFKSTTTTSSNAIAFSFFRTSSNAIFFFFELRQMRFFFFFERRRMRFFFFLFESQRNRVSFFVRVLFVVRDATANSNLMSNEKRLRVIV